MLLEKILVKLNRPIKMARWRTPIIGSLQRNPISDPAFGCLYCWQRHYVSALDQAFRFRSYRPIPLDPYLD